MGSHKECSEKVFPETSREGYIPGTESLFARKLKVEPNSGSPRDWDVNHSPKWSDREFPPDATREDVINDYQKGTDLNCPTCNRSDNQPSKPPMTQSEFAAA